MNSRTVYLLLPLFGLILIACSGCGTIIGKNINTEINDNFNINHYKRYYSDSDDASAFLDDALWVFFKEQGLIFDKTMNKKGDIKVYITAEQGFCLPPRYNSRIGGYWYTFPRKVAIKLEDAITKKVLLEIYYKRALFATGADYEECENIIIEALKKALAESKKNPTNPSKQ